MSCPPPPMTDHSFGRFLLEEKLMGGRCAGCGALFVPPRAICPACGGSEMAWEQVKGTGTLAAFTCIAMVTPALQAEGYGRDNPFCTGVVLLDEGPRVVARIEGLDTTRPEEIRLGTPLRVRFLRRGEGEEERGVLAFHVPQDTDSDD